MNHDQIYFIKSQRGRKVILYQGYSYNLHRSETDRSTWRCRDRKCKKRLYLKNEQFAGSIPHSHEISLEMNEADYLRDKARNRSLAVSERPRGIIKKEFGIVNTSILKHLPMTRNFIDNITKFSKKNNISNNYSEIPSEIRTTYADELFLLHDSGQETENRFLIFSTESHLSYLKKSDFWYCDGTFKSCPRGFEQLYNNGEN
ncbi:hypothetical protein DMUE_1095 [Dictyocoela muelleri]|nr:hypothetical protein DMUE_1095 [Dictyocoela muelleri]